MIVAAVPLFTFTVAVAVFVQPFEPVTVYVIVAEPAVTPLTTPVDEFTVATAVLDDVHTPPAVAEANCVVEPVQTFVAPVIEATVGFTLTFTVIVNVDPEQDPAVGVTV